MHEKLIQRTENYNMTAAALAVTLGAVLLSGCNKNSSVETSPEWPAQTSASTEPAVDTPIGYDVSYPQCDKLASDSLPKPTAFAIVGVNESLPTKFNPCFKKMVKWAARSTGETDAPRLSFYVTAANPVEENVPTWPKSGNTPYGQCGADRSEACAYQYGVNRAKDDLDAKKGGLRGAVKYMPKNERRVWIDVEGEYSWATGADGQDLNRATLEGMTETFGGEGIKVGFYSKYDVWMELIGKVPAKSVLYKTDVWKMGGQSVDHALQLCKTASSFTGGAIRMAQIPGERTSNGIDWNVACTQ